MIAAQLSISSKGEPRSSSGSVKIFRSPKSSSPAATLERQEGLDRVTSPCVAAPASARVPASSCQGPCRLQGMRPVQVWIRDAAIEHRSADKDATQCATRLQSSRARDSPDVADLRESWPATRRPKSATTAIPLRLRCRRLECRLRQPDAWHTRNLDLD